jgi:hypothetical protein
VTSSIFDILLGSNETISLEDPRVTNGHSFGPVAKVSNIDITRGSIPSHRRYCRKHGVGVGCSHVNFL